MPTTIAATESHFVVRAGEKLTAFLELERAVCIHLLSTHKIKFDTLSLIE
jgi:hypothetical protein